jgi:nicotinamidase-related amidase
MPSKTPKHRLDREHAQLLVVDIQEKLLPHIHEHEHMVAQAERMIRAASVLDIPITISEQYPEGLGGTVDSIRAAGEGAVQAEKMTFSFCADAACRQRIGEVLRPQVLLVGMETHVCVYQTALDLLDLQMTPVVLADAVGSRRPRDHDVALDGLRAAGVVVTTVESAIFQLVHDSGSELFKRILPIVK